MSVTLIQFSGLAGTGKTTLAHLVARRLQIPVVSFDHFLDYGLPRHLWGVEEITMDDLWHVLFNFAELQLSLGLSVIMDAVFAGSGRTRARELATRYNAQYRAIHTFCLDEAIWRERVTRRFETAPATETPAKWENMPADIANFRPWRSDEALFVDAVRSVDENMARVLDYIQQ